MDELSLTFRINITLPELEFKINAEQVSYGLKSLATKDIVALKFGYWSPPNIAMAHYFHFRDRQGQVLETAFNSIVYGMQQRDAWQKQIEAVIHQQFTFRIVQDMHSQLVAGREVHFEHCHVSKHGFHFTTRKWFKKLPQCIPWTRIGFAKSHTPCSTFLGDLQDADVKFEFRFGPQWNGQFLIKYIDLLKKSPSMLAELTK